MKNIRPLLIMLLLLGGVFILSGVSLAVDPNVNTQLTDLRSNGSNGNPGFDPCLGTRTAAGACSAGTGLLSANNLTTVFPTLGPGAVTDNMFGIVAGADASGTPIPTTNCGQVIGSGTVTATIVGLNCGDLRFDPTSQGQSVPTGNNTLSSNPVSMNFVLISDFCSAFAGGGTDCPSDNTFPATGATQIEGAHLGLADVNNFTWTQLTATTAQSDSVQSLTQVTAVKQTGIGTRAAPGAGDQEFTVGASFSGTSSNNVVVVPLIAGSNVVNWNQSIQDPDQSGLGTTGKFSQVTAGSFTIGASAFPTVQYPSGQTQTNGVQGASVNIP